MSVQIRSKAKRAQKDGRSAKRSRKEKSEVGRSEEF